MWVLVTPTLLVAPESERRRQDRWDDARGGPNEYVLSKLHHSSFPLLSPLVTDSIFFFLRILVGVGLTLVYVHFVASCFGVEQHFLPFHALSILGTSSFQASNES